MDIIHGHFSFIGISQTILDTSYVKWIDVWMVFVLIVPFLEASVSSESQQKLTILENHFFFLLTVLAVR